MAAQRPWSVAVGVRMRCTHKSKTGHMRPQATGFTNPWTASCGRCLPIGAPAPTSRGPRLALAAADPTIQCPVVQCLVSHVGQPHRGRAGLDDRRGTILLRRDALVKLEGTGSALVGALVLWLSGHTNIRFTCHGSGSPTAIDEIYRPGVWRRLSL